MDIPKRPIHSGPQASPQTEQAKPQQVAISSIQDLKLEEGKVYSGKVISQNTPPPSAANPSTTSSQTLIANKEWLVQVKGQTIIISSEKPLENGQKLLLKIDSSSTPEKPSLIAQLIGNKTTAGSQQSSSHLSKTLASSQTLLNTQSLSLSEKASITNGSTAFDKALIKPLLQAINATLDKQVPLQQGFDKLNTLASKTSVNSSANTELKPLASDMKLAESVKQNILNTLPKLNNILQTNQASFTTTQNSGQYLRQSVNDSGLFFEKNLTSKPEFLNAFKDHLNTLNQRIAQPDTLQSQLPQPTHSAREKIQQTIEALLQLASNSLPKSPSNKIANEFGQEQSDLKATLLSASAFLAKQLASELSEAELKSLFLSQNTQTTLASPFIFPVINHTRTHQSNALFDSPELTTGQLLKLLAGMIHKLQFNQLNSLMQSNTGNESALQQTWFFELPILNPNQTVNTFNFRLDKEQQESRGEQETNDNDFQWKLLLSFDLDSLGPIYVQVTLSKNTVSSVLWADQQSTLTLLENESSHFKSQLENIGLNVSDILCQKGQPSSKQAQLDRRLVDTKA